MRYLIILAALLSGCGGGGDDNAGCAHVAIPHTDPDIVAYGDSTMYGEGTMLQEALKARGHDLKVDNRGIGGTMLAHALRANCKYPETIKVALANDKRASYVLENYGLNDALNTSAQEFEGNLREFVSTVVASGKTPVIVTPNKVLGNPSYATKVETISQVCRKVAADTGAILADVQADITLSQQQMSDSIHPAGSGYYVIAGYIAGKLIADIEAKK